MKDPSRRNQELLENASLKRRITELESKCQRTEEALQQEHAEFKQHVVERTDELRRINKELQKEITARKEIEEKIRQIVYHDSLTGLPNRKLFSDRLYVTLTRARRNKKEVVIAMVDLDHLKDVNDTLGHHMGDLLLQATAERLSATLRQGDTVARFGGDHFLLILPDLNGIEDAIQVTQKIVEIFRKPFLIDGHQLVVTTSIGIAIYPHDGINEGSLLKNADIARYQAKQAGGDRYQLYILKASVCDTNGI